MSNENNMAQSFEITQKRSGNALIDAAQTREMSEVQASIVLAKRFPRDINDAINRILNACTRKELADCAVYQYARGGTDVTGPSIRLAEAIAQNWGNLTFGVRELEQRNGESTVEAFAWDMETNTRQVKVFQVPHKRDTKKGGYMLTDSRDIYEMVANQGARRLRACILGVIPGDVVDKAVAQCEATVVSKDGEVTPQKIQKLVDAFKKYGVTREMLVKFTQRSLESITPQLMARLVKIGNSLRDGMSTAEDWFDIEPETDKPRATASDLLNKNKKDPPKETPPPPPPPAEDDLPYDNPVVAVIPNDAAPTFDAP